MILLSTSNVSPFATLRTREVWPPVVRPWLPNNNGVVPARQEMGLLVAERDLNLFFYADLEPSPLLLSSKLYHPYRPYHPWGVRILGAIEVEY